MAVGEVVYTISGVRRWTSPDGNLVRDYITLETFGKEADDRNGPIKLHIERAGGGRGSHGMTKAGMARWSYGAHWESGSNQARADELVRELLANIVESERWNSKSSWRPPSSSTATTGRGPLRGA